MAYELSQSNCNDKTDSKFEKYILNGANGTKCVLTLNAYQIVDADLLIKMLKTSTNHIMVYRFKLDVQNPWIVYQLQESSNYLNESLQLAESIFEFSNCYSACHSYYVLNSLMLCLKKSRDLLIDPSKSFNSSRVSQSNVKFTPELPHDLDITVKLQSPKLVCTVYQLSANPKAQTIVDSKFSMESMIPRLNDSMIMISRAIMLCQMLKDKLACVHHCDLRKWINDDDECEDCNDQ